MKRSTPDAAVTIDPTHNTYATLGELHLDREQDLFCDVRVGVQARSLRLPRARPPRGTTVSTARCCATYSSRCTTTAGARGYAGPGCVIPVTLRHPASAAARQAVRGHSHCSVLDSCHASTFSLLLLYDYVVKLYDVSVHLDLCARAPRVLQTAWSLLTFNKPVMCARLPCRLHDMVCQRERTRADGGSRNGGREWHGGRD
jgi:hypothetical protein